MGKDIGFEGLFVEKVSWICFWIISRVIKLCFSLKRSLYNSSSLRFLVVNLSRYWGWG